jgi:hypothetical protein
MVINPHRESKRMKLPLFSLSPINLNAGSVRDWEDMEDLEIRTPEGTPMIVNVYISREKNAPHCDARLVSHDRGPIPDNESSKSTKAPKKQVAPIAKSSRGPYLAQRAVDRINSAGRGEHARLLLTLVEGEKPPIFK